MDGRNSRYTDAMASTVPCLQQGKHGRYVGW
jgi:hypothetical protein